MLSISNDIISIKVAEKGAELQSLYHKKNGLEYMWSGDPAYWGKHSPVLFPIVGELKHKSYTFKGNTYQLGRHGFARDMDFVVTEQNETSIILSLESDEQTLKVYPFHFVFSVGYELRHNGLRVSFKVSNTGTERMFFSVGAHPAFKVPLVEGTSFEDWQIVFTERESVGRWPITPDGLINSQSNPLLEDESVLPLKKELFASDAIVLKGLRSNAVSIRSTKTENGLTVHLEDFPYLGIWETKGGDFVCIEPWCGIADSVNATGNLEEKEGINVLEADATFEVAYTVDVF